MYVKTLTYLINKYDTGLKFLGLNNKSKNLITKSLKRTSNILT